MNMIKWAVLALCVALLVGCDPVIGPSLGTYRNELTADGCIVTASTIKGGPDVQCEVGSDGRATMTVAPSRAQAIDALTNLIKP